MRATLIILTLAYVLSQFYRAFLAVMAPQLGVDIGAGPAELASASGMWFIVFALMQIPIGELLDRIGPRLTASVMFAIGGAGGAAVFAMAQVPWHVSLAMGLQPHHLRAPQVSIAGSSRFMQTSSSRLSCPATTNS